MSIDAFEKREQTLQLHANVLQAEQGAHEKCIMLSGVHIAI